MCLILFAWQSHPRYPLIVAANRDEFHARPSAAADWWKDAPDLLAGRDLQAGGTWMGVNRRGRFAAVTNYREPQTPEQPLERSRGSLVVDYLAGKDSAAISASRVMDSGDAYHGFSLLLGDGADLVCVSNRMKAPVRVAPGIHALSNHLLDTGWPKAKYGCLRLEGLIKDKRVEAERLMEVLTDRSLVPGEEPEAFDLHLAPERLTRIAFVVSPDYGTRCSTVLLIDRESRAEYVERQFDSDGSMLGTVQFEFSITSGRLADRNHQKRGDVQSNGSP